MPEQAPVAPVTEPVVTPVVPEVKEPTVKEALDPKPEPKMVPEAALIEIKKENKQLAKDMKALQKKIEEGGDKKEVSADLKALGEKYNVDSEFLAEFRDSVKAQANEEFEAKLKPIEEKEKAAETDKRATEVINKALEELPEFKTIVKQDTLKSLMQLPANANKTIRTIMEENFGHLVTGKRTLQPSIPGGGKEAAEIDHAKAAKDPEYFAQIMSDPASKKKYNEGMAKRLKL